jgi:undecaprenyl-diphosphatase
MCEKIGHIIRKDFKWIALVISTLLFIEIAEDLLKNELNTFDSAIYGAISSIASDPITVIFKVITNLSGALTVIIMSLFSIILFKDKRYGFYVSFNLVTISLINYLLKNIFSRPRPVNYRLIDATGYSFPSGHSMVSMAFYGFIIYLIYMNVKNVKVKWSLCISIGVLILLIGVSRVYLGVHYATDVIAGFCFSLSYLILFINIYSRRLKINKKESDIKIKGA